MKTKLLYDYSTQVAYTPVEVNEFIIVPVVMMVEGVHNGSHGAIYHSAATLASGISAWSHKPITLAHPRTLDGAFVSVNEVSTDAWVIGHVDNVRMEGNKLKGDAYFSVQKLTALSPDALTAIRDGKMMEVSIGVFSEEIEAEGMWNNEQYTAIARNHEPDHLALLPGEVGACSIMDGCGLRVNTNIKKGGNLDVLTRYDFVNLRTLNERGMFVLPVVYAQGLKDKLEKVRQSLYANDSETDMYYLEELYDSYAVFMHSTREGEIYKDTLFKQSYKIGANGEVTWEGQPEKVTRQVKYVTIDNNSKEEKIMCEKCKEKAKALVANANTHFTDDDLAWLEELSEDKLDKFIPKVITNTKTKTVEVEKEVTPEQAWKVLNLNKDQYEKGVEFYNQKRADVIKTITDNTEDGVWTEDDLNKMELGTLEKLAKSVKRNAAEDTNDGNFLGVSVGGFNTNTESGKVQVKPMFYGVDPNQKKN